jgi:high-affinity nickel-transport protein
MVSKRRNVIRNANPETRRKLISTYALLLAINVITWSWALVAFHDHPVLLGTALLAYGFGLRHAVDADHIAAIDNVTRKLMQEGQRPAMVGFFFSMGHSAVVVIASLLVALTTSALSDRFEGFKEIGGVIGTSVSATFLLIIALMNLIILRSIYKAWENVRTGGK